MEFIEIVDLVICGVFLIISLILAVFGAEHRWEEKEDEVHRHNNR